MIADGEGTLASLAVDNLSRFDILEKHFEEDTFPTENTRRSADTLSEGLFFSPICTTPDEISAEDTTPSPSDNANLAQFGMLKDIVVSPSDDTNAGNPAVQGMLKDIVVSPSADTNPVLLDAKPVLLGMLEDLVVVLFVLPVVDQFVLPVVDHLVLPVVDQLVLPVVDLLVLPVVDLLVLPVVDLLALPALRKSASSGLMNGMVMKRTVGMS